MDPKDAQNLWRSERLVFRSLLQDDQDWMFNEIDTDPANMMLSRAGLLAPPKRQKPDEWIKTWAGDGPADLLVVVICLAGSTSAIESSPKTRIGYMRLSYGGYGSSPHNRACELGITLAAPHQDKGYGTEAINWALDWAFRHANMHSVNLGSVEYNTRAHRCYEKCGFKIEGRRRQCCWHNRRWYDNLFFGILETEWEEMRSSQKREDSKTYSQRHGDMV